MQPYPSEAALDYFPRNAPLPAAVRVTIAAVKATIAAVKGLIAAIAAGGWVAVVIILLICLIALIVGSCFVCSGT